MADFKLQAEIELDSSQAQKSLDTVEKKAGADLQKALNKTGQTAKKTGQQLKDLSGKAVTGLKNVAKGFVAVGAAAGAAGVVVAKLVDGFNELTGKNATARLFGGTAEGVKAIKKALDQTVTSSEALQISAQLATAGFDTGKAQGQVALLAKSLGTLAGETTDAIFAQLRAGEVTGLLADKYPALNQQIQTAIARKTALQGVETTSAQNFKISARIIQREAGGILAKVNELNKPSLMAQFMAQVRELRDEFIKKFGPALARFVEDFKNGLPVLKARLIELGEDFKNSEFVKTLKKAYELLKDTVNLLDNLRPSKALKTVTGGAYLGTSKQAMAAQDAIDKMLKRKRQAFIKKEGAEKAAAAKKEEKQQKEIETKRAARLAVIRAKRRAADKQQRFDEIKAMQDEGKALLRNFGANYTDAVSALGGTFSGIIASQKDFYELSRVFSALYGKTILDNIKLSDKAIRNNEKLSKNEKQAVLLLKRRQEAGKLDAEERFLMERNVIEQMRAGLSLSAADQKLAALRVEERMNVIDVENSIKSIKLMIQKIDADGLKADQKARKFYVSSLESYKKIKAEKQAIFDLTRKIAYQEKIQELRVANARRRKEEEDAREKLRGLRIEMQGIADPAGAALLQEAATRESRVNQLLSTIRDQRVKIAGLFRDEQMGEKEVQKGILNSMLLQLEVVKKINALTAQRNTVSMQFLDLMKQELVGLTAKTAQMFKGVFDSVVGGIGGMISGTFETIVTDGIGAAAKNAGKLFLDVLAGAASAMGAYFITTGTAQLFVPPYSGAGAIAAGAGLLALSGLLKGASSLVGFDAPASGGSGGGGGASSAPAPPQSLPGQSEPRDLRPVQFYFSVNQEPWNSRSDQERFNSLRNWSRKMGRSTGIADPFGMAAKVGGRGR